MTRGTLTRTQIARLLKPVRADRVETKQNRSYVPQHEVRAELVRIFGPGNVDHTMHDPVLIYETRIADGDPQFPKNANAPYYYVACYKAGCTLRVRDYAGNDVAEFTEYHIEENAPLPNRGEAHAMAVTSAQSYALRRAAISLGDALGLHLYNNGSLAPLIGGSLQLVGDPDAPFYVAPKAAELTANAATGEVIGEEDQTPALPEDDDQTHPVDRVPSINDAFKKPTTTRRKAAATAEAAGA